jgi:AraC-like DNA-binding protein
MLHGISSLSHRLTRRTSGLRAPEASFDTRGMDVLADVFAALRIGGIVYSHNELTAPWGIAFDRSNKAGFHVIVRGSCWLRTESRRPIALDTGDVVLLPRGWTHSLADTPDGPAVSYRELRKRSGRGAATTLICGAYALAPEATRTLLSLLPPIVHVRGVDATSDIADAVRLLAREAPSTQPGAVAAAARLSDLLLIYVLRAWLEAQPEGSAGWLGALRDPPVAQTLARFHQRPEVTWELAELARDIGVSRATLVRRFTSLVGTPPLTYLARWRMAVAGRLLRETSHALAEIGERVGYKSEFAFNRAFKREYRVPPGVYRRHVGAQA